MTDQPASMRSGLLLGLAAYLCWGFMPLYFKAMAAVPAAEIVAHRIVWSLLFLGALAMLFHRWPTIRAALAERRVLAILVLTSLLIGTNWLVFIYAIVSDHVLEGSLGYYLNPLFNVLLGVVVLKERLSRAQLAAVVLAAIGVAVLAAGAGSGLWISLVLAVSFGLYGFVRKVAPVGALEGLTVETLFLTPAALAWLFWQYQGGTLGFGRLGIGMDLLLVMGGAATAIPLLLFTAAARRLPYSTLGFLQYIAPSLQFLLAVFAFGERLTTAHIVCFGLIWTALAIFSADGWRRAASAGRAARAKAEELPAIVTPS